MFLNRKLHYIACNHNHLKHTEKKLNTKLYPNNLRFILRVVYFMIWYSIMQSKIAKLWLFITWKWLNLILYTDEPALFARKFVRCSWKLQKANLTNSQSVSQSIILNILLLTFSFKHNYLYKRFLYSILTVQIQMDEHSEGKKETYSMYTIKHNSTLWWERSSQGKADISQIYLTSYSVVPQQISVSYKLV